ncbi:Protein of unknown function [Cotesia congregata]|uniref:Uncharacterized protein n=1 Tax=Cotesia congregata TaxID=51543 RepID=A0A8J2HS06_COTCN|nr:Protein of unknown function [Cotesia congregata]
MSSSECSSEKSEAEEVRRNIPAEAAEIIQNLASNRINLINEDVLLVYFKDLFKTLAPSTIWSRWSMLRTMISINQSIEIRNYSRLKTLIKNNAKSHRQKKSKVFSWNEIKKFIDEAPDNGYLIEKVVVIFGITGAMRGGEFPELRVQDVEDTGSQLIVTILKTKTDYPRTFVIGPEYRNKILQYKALRPNNSNTDRASLEDISSPLEMDHDIVMDYFNDDFSAPIEEKKTEHSKSSSKPVRPSTHSPNSGLPDAKRRKKISLRNDDIQNILKSIPENANIKFENCKFEFHFHYHEDKEN